MDIRRASFGGAIRLAIVLSTIATFVALGLDAAGGVSRPAIVLSVIVIGFVASWIQSGRTARPTVARARHHRVAVVRVRHPIG